MGFSSPRSAAPVVAAACLLLAACGARRGTDATLPIHLEDQLAAAQIEGAVVNAALAKPMTWNLGTDGAKWKALPNRVAGATTAQIEATQQGLKLRITEASPSPEGGDNLDGGAYVEVDGFDIDRWSHVEIEARASADTTWIGIGYNLADAAKEKPEHSWPTAMWGSSTRVIGDGKIHSYRIPMAGEEGPVVGPGGRRRVGVCGRRSGDQRRSPRVLGFPHRLERYATE